MKRFELLLLSSIIVLPVCGLVSCSTNLFFEPGKFLKKKYTSPLKTIGGVI